MLSREAKTHSTRIGLNLCNTQTTVNGDVILRLLSETFILSIPRVLGNVTEMSSANSTSNISRKRRNFELNPN